MSRMPTLRRLIVCLASMLKKRKKKYLKLVTLNSVYASKEIKIPQAAIDKLTMTK